jgi:type VI secretion system secreted protein Hcp
MRKKMLWAAAVAVLIVTPAVVGLLVVRGDDGRRTGALTEAGVGGGYQLEIAGLPPSGEAMVIQAYSWGGSANATLGPGLTAGKVQINDLHVTKKIDKASPLLVKGLASGAHHTSATLSLYRGGAGEKPQKYLEYKMTDVLITSVQHEGTADDVPTETVSLAFEQLQITVEDKDEGGALDKTTFQYNLAEG